MPPYTLPGGTSSNNYGQDRSTHSHGGVDWRAPGGTDIPSAAGGTVQSSGYRADYGNYVILEHDINGQRTYTLHGHMQNTPTLRVGDNVNQGDVVGQVGSTGRSTGNHLHFEVRQGGTEGASPLAWPRTDPSTFDFPNEPATPTAPVEPTSSLPNSGTLVASNGSLAGLGLGGGSRPPDADSPWFTFTAEAGPLGGFGVYSFSGREEVSAPYEFEIELVCRSADVDVISMLGTPALLTIADKSGGTRLVHGLIREMEQLHTANRVTHYRAVVVPRLWFLGRIVDHRIFQNLSIVEIIEKLLTERGFGGEDFSFKLSKSYNPREYCVQYGETDLHFISRLCEEEGVFFYFEHKEGAHVLCFCDAAGGPKIPGESDLRFFSGSGQPADTAVVSRLRLHQAVNSNSAAYREWNFTQPKLDLFVKEKEGDPKKAPVPEGMDLEQYRYPHLYELKSQGTNYAKLQLDRQLTFARWIECESDVSRWLPSYTFTLREHPRDDINDGWWVVAVRHEGEQPGVLGHEAPSGRGMQYHSSVIAIPEQTRFVPALDHPKNRVIGNQTAIVTGPKGEEIYPDKYGRVKVQFFWDREGEWDEKTTCWIRASQNWAGGQYGSMVIPRIGHEVIVSFLECNPDRPLITGLVYHDLNKVPYELPTHKTRTVIYKSLSSPGGGGFNELRIEDKKGAEEIYLHAEKDVNTFTKNDWKDHILRDRHQTVDRHTYLETKGETHETLRGQRKTEQFANENRTVHGDEHLAVDGKWLLKAGDEVHVKAGMKVVIEAGAELTLKAGGQWIRLDPSGIKTSPVLRIGQGPAGNGSGAAPLLPEKTLASGESTVPIPEKFRKPISLKTAQRAAYEKKAEEDKPFCPVCEEMAQVGTQ